jgi:hypothetical protein
MRRAADPVSNRNAALNCRSARGTTVARDEIAARAVGTGPMRRTPAALDAGPPVYRRTSGARSSPWIRCV